MAKKENKPDDRSQLAAFRKAARELGGDNSKERFQGVLRTLAKAKPQAQSPKKAKRA